MNTARNALVIVLTLTTLAGGVLAWRQYQELVQLRPLALNAGERDALRSKIKALQTQNRDLEERLNARSSVADTGGAVAAETAPKAATKAGDGARKNRSERRAERLLAMRDLMNNPDMQAAMNSSVSSVIDARYAALFRKMGLPAEQTESLRALLVERMTTAQDVYIAAREQGITPRSDPEAFQKLMTDAQNGINANIKAAIGDQGFAALADYEKTLPQRAIVENLQKILATKSTPQQSLRLSDTAADNLVNVLASNSPAPKSPTGASLPALQRPATMYGANLNPTVLGPGSAPITTQAINAAGSSGLLNSAQIDALKNLQQQQLAAKKLENLVKKANQPTTTPKAAATSPAPSASAKR